MQHAQGRCAGVILMGSHLALLPTMETEVLEQLLAAKRAGQSTSHTLASQLGNAVLLDLAKLGVKKVWPGHARHLAQIFQSGAKIW